MEKMYDLTLVLLSLCGVYSDSHSLRYYYTVVSAPGLGLPEFSLIRYVDDQQIDVYSSDNRRTVPVAPWVKRKMRPEYWEGRTQIGKEYEALHRHEVKTIMRRLNHTGGFHFVQGMHSCELRDDGSTAWNRQYRYDGDNYMYLDTETAMYMPIMADAQITAQRWNSPDVRMGERHKTCLENTCVDDLKRFIKYGREELEWRDVNTLVLYNLYTSPGIPPCTLENIRPIAEVALSMYRSLSIYMWRLQEVRPQVKVTDQKLDGATKLHCLVYGFHPRAVDVKWMKNGVDDVPSYDTTHVLPNPDGTYQIRVSVEVLPKEGDSYSCYVEHSSLEEPLLVNWEPAQDSPVVVIIGVVVAIVIVLAVAVIIYCRKVDKKKKNNYMVANTSETSSNSDKPVTA